MATYNWTPEHIRTKLIGAHGWVYYNWAIENEASVLGTNRVRIGLGYIGQEKERLRKVKPKTIFGHS